MHFITKHIFLINTYNLIIKDWAILFIEFINFYYVCLISRYVLCDKSLIDINKIIYPRKRVSTFTQNNLTPV